MGTDGKAEACGRCTMTSVVGLTADGEDGPSGQNPFDGERIELDDAELRSASPHVVAFGRLKGRLDAWASHLVYGR